MNRSIPALAIAGALVLGSAIVAAPAQATPGDGTYYSVPGTSFLFTVDAVDGKPALGVATYEEWQEDGFPSPRPAAVEYLKYTWDSTIYQDATVDGVSFSTRIDYATWRSVGFPAPRTDRLAADSEIHRYTGSDELFVWAGAAFTDDPAVHKLTFAEFAHLGYPAVDYESEPEFRKLSWSPNIVGPVDQAGTIGVVDFATWDYYARPTPQIVTSFDGDRFCKAAGSADIRYVGIAAPKGVKLSYAQWREAGFPAPGRC
ncbi:hypothetical protein ACR8AL_07670 [Clavibacter sepedonicus]|uniref:Exported protein n=1 Tax=Clavibacter sepedonicus TaxID=31964 RepID=B0RCS6_CLASE|nr:MULTISPECIES: hypothetical protein [Clavibacter]MBD5381029.1 hypothetical protein [Clavibacter sp.]OQJ47507.1 hypothetical protein B5P19_03865 [Clavibacter sepedonicus]OQJ53063.1 hypothetical protein B5P20_02125 [Clavibacter sepedonicus]UUK64212.1 hypothetical protein LRE50_07780 [Clavibacter sepedonicus]CAQ01847.1 putative exported protein [Clavibacter sepedonicus]